MAGFRYLAYDTHGKPSKGVLEADSAKSARAQLRADGLTPHTVEPIAGSGAMGRLATPALSQGAVTRLVRSLASLIAAGLPVDEALSALIEQAESDRERNVLAQIRGDVVAGAPLSSAMSKLPRMFAPMTVALVSAGEASGKLAHVLERLALHMEARHAAASRIGVALVYPVIVLIVALAVTGLLLAYVVPQVAQVFVGAKTALPWLTRMLIATGAIVRDYGWWLLAALVIAAVALKSFAGTAAGRATLHGLWLRLPFAGRLARSFDTARFASTLAILSGGGVPILKALETARDVLQLQPLQVAATQATERVRGGVPLSRALAEQKAFPPVLVRLVGAGESTGDLAGSLDRAAREQEAQALARLQTVAAIAEPAIILGVGLLVLLIVLGVLLPIFDLNRLVGR